MADRIEPVGKQIEDAVFLPVLAGSSITFEKGDMLWWDQANSTVNKASSFTWDTDEPTTRRKFAAMFAGIADAAHLDLQPGEYEILKKEEIAKTGFTTHDLSPVMFIEYLENQTEADIYMLAVQPERVGFGDEMSDKVKSALNEITNLIKEAQNA